jgi:polyphosphate kinase 2 (PPK2 family)
MLASPWTAVTANDKHFARIKVLKTIVDTLDKVLAENAGKKKNK